MTQVYWKCPVSATQCKDFEKSSSDTHGKCLSENKTKDFRRKAMGQGKAVIHLWFGVCQVAAGFQGKRRAMFGLHVS